MNLPEKNKIKLNEADRVTISVRKNLSKAIELSEANETTYKKDLEKYIIELNAKVNAELLELDQEKFYRTSKGNLPDKVKSLAQIKEKAAVFTSFFFVIFFFSSDLQEVI